MSSIQTGIQLNDQFSMVLNGIVNSVNMAVAAMYDMQQGMSADIDTSGIEGARDEINQTAAALHAMNEALDNQDAFASNPASNIMPPIVDIGNPSVINVDVNPVLPDPLIENPEPIRTEVQPRAPTERVEVPFEWKSYDGLDVFISTGVDRFQQELSSLNDLMNQVNATQYKITQAANESEILSPEASYDVQELENRIYGLFNQIQRLQDASLELGTDEANNQLERLRSQMAQLQQLQSNLNQAMDAGNVEDINDAYLRLTQSISNAQRYVRDITVEQERLDDAIDEGGNRQEEFNQKIQEGTRRASDLTDTIKNAVMAYVSIQGMGKVMDISDDLVQTTARLNLMNDGVQSTEELVNMVYAAAQDARGSFAEMADVVARFGNNAKDAFGSSEEVVAFANLIQKQMTIAGASTQEASNAMLQLSQALGSGVLRGDELNSIFEQAPNLIQSIADYLDVPLGQIREMAADGELSADIVKAAIFASADDINAKFATIPLTWGQAMTMMQNAALKAFQPVLQYINQIVNSSGFQMLADGAVETMAVVANVVLNIFDLIGDVGNFAADNWSILSPIVYGVIGALAVYAAYLAIVNGIEVASAAAGAAMAVGKGLLAAATMIATHATWTQTTAQMGLNSAMYACPILWVILLIIALIAVILAVCGAIAKMTGMATSGFGIMCGGINVVIQFFRNLGISIANIALGIWNALGALCSNMITAFHNAISSVQSFFYNLLSTAMTVIAGICRELNKLPFVEFDYSGITSAASDYAAKAAAGDKEDYTSVLDAFNQGMSTFETFQDGWASDAFKAGAEWGDGIADAVGNFSLADLFGKVEMPNVDEYTSGFGDYSSGFGDALANSGIGDDLGSIAGDTGAIKDSLDVTQEDLKYLRDLAEQEVVNRYTVAEIHIDQSGMQNTINSGDDIDGFMEKLEDSVNEAIDNMTEGVHE